MAWHFDPGGGATAGANRGVDFTSGTQPGSGRGGETPLTGPRGHGGGHGVGGGDRGGTGSGLSKQNTGTAVDAMNYLMGHGYSREGAASAVGQILTEDPAFALASTAVAGDSGSAHGLFQWRGDRYTGLKRYLAETGKTDSIHSELDYFMSGRDPGDRGLAEKLKRATSTEEGNRLGYRYEGYRGGIQERRKRDADKLLKLNTKKVSVRSMPGSDVFAQSYATATGTV